MIEVLARLNSDEMLVPDFSIPLNWSKPDGDRRWASGDSSVIARPYALRHDGPIHVYLTVDPTPGLGSEQTIRIVAENEVKRTLSFDSRVLFGFAMRNDATRFSNQCLFEIEHVQKRSTSEQDYALGFANITVVRAPNARMPTISRTFSNPKTPLPALASLSDKELMNRFISLGDNCEFGLAQRSFDADPMDMLRFIGIQLEGLLEGLNQEFIDIDSIEKIYFKLVGREYIFVCPAFGVQMHTLLFEGENTPEQIFHRQLTKLSMQRRLLVDDLYLSERIFVYKQNYPISDSALSQLYDRLRSKAPNNLLSVVLADDFHPPGTVLRIKKGLFRGYIDTFSPYDDAAGARSHFWLVICKNAFSLLSEDMFQNVKPAGIENYE